MSGGGTRSRAAKPGRRSAEGEAFPARPGKSRSSVRRSPRARLLFTPFGSFWRRRREDAGERRQAGEGGRAGETQRRLAAALEEEALHPHRGRASAYPAQAGAGGGGGGFSSCQRGARGGRRQNQAVALLHHEDGGLRGAEGQVHVFHGGDGRGEGGRLSVPAGSRLERRDHAATSAVQKPAGHPGGQVDPAEAAAPRPAARAPPPKLLQLRLDGPPRQIKFKRRFWK